MKWPSRFILIRHAESAYNVLRVKKREDPLYREFRDLYIHDPDSLETRELARQIADKHALGVSDYETDITHQGELQAANTGRALAKAFRDGNFALPDIVFCSPYLRTVRTLAILATEWRELGDVKRVMDDRIREQEHGLSLLYSDWRVFQTLHPEQRKLRELMGPYWYQFPQGESISQVRERARAFKNMLVREWANKNVLAVTHHIFILADRANAERLSPEEFIHLDRHEKPVNCGMTVYRGDPSGKDGRLVLEVYNKKFY
jgi:broad specificity phosphatase PhoE